MMKYKSITPGICPALAAFAAVMTMAVTATADDDDIVNAMGFEPNPPYGFTTTFLGTGQLEGQVNPPGEGQVISPGQWLRTKGPGLSTAFVENTVFAPGGGTQAVRVDKVANSDDRWAVPVNHLGYPDYPSPFPPEPQQPCICITWDMRVEQTSGPQDTFGPLFGIEAYDDDANPVGLLGSMFVDATTAEVLYQAPDTGFLTPTGDLVAFGDWNRYQIKLDYSTHEYSIYLNGLPRGTFGYVDQNNIPGGLNEFSDADIATLAGAGDPASRALTGTGYFDNYLVREGECPGIVPEPSTLLMLMSGLLGMISNGRRHRRVLV
jgi:hypothetical protein